MMPPRDLFNGYLDGELTSEELSRLDAWIAADAKNAADFLDWIALQAWTREAIQSDLLQQVLRGPETDGDQALKRASNIEASADQRSRRTSRSAWAAIAASLLVAATAYWWSATSSPTGRVANAGKGDEPVQDAVAEFNREAEESPVVATVTRLEQCVWASSQTSLGYGQQLVEGTQVSIRSGVARVTFESGAEALLEGPCDFVVDNAMHGTIRSGRVSVTAPKRAYGFRIRAPNAEVIDLGTEFGVTVDEGGNSEVHVFSGEVLSRSVDKQGAQLGELFRVTANNALKFAALDELPSKIASDNSLFAQLESVKVHAVARDSLPSDEGLALWLAADVSAKTQEGRRVVAWSDILFGDNVSAEDALQPDVAAQPKLVADGINGRPAVRFNGKSSYLVTTPLETTDDQTIFMVCQYSQAAMRPGRKRGGQILNYNGPPYRLVSSTYEPGVLQIGEPIVEGFAPTRLGGKLFSGRLDGKDVSESEMYASPLGVGVPVVLAYRYDLSNHQASLWINNELIEQKPALRPAGVTSRKTIGRHGFMNFFFAGELGELMIYNNALDAADLEAVTTYLSKKYNIPLKQPAA
ncbi:MAG: FecR domain-containing protein [Pirellulales bacterium]|nr:FecR domain-containing protein [Pirellulales bacterium]